MICNAKLSAMIGNGFKLDDVRTLIGKPVTHNNNQIGKIVDVSIENNEILMEINYDASNMLEQVHSVEIYSRPQHSILD